jgi:hypothetical protein
MLGYVTLGYVTLGNVRLIAIDRFYASPIQDIFSK